MTEYQVTVGQPEFLPGGVVGNGVQIRLMPGERIVKAEEIREMARRQHWFHTEDIQPCCERPSCCCACEETEGES
jgi:hypothetical protein